MSDTDRQQARDDHDAIARLEGEIAVLKQFTGADGVNGMYKQFESMKTEIAERFEQVYKKLDAMEKKREDAAKWRVGTIIAAVSSIATLGMLIYMMANGG